MHVQLALMHHTYIVDSHLSLALLFRWGGGEVNKVHNKYNTEFIGALSDGMPLIDLRDSFVGDGSMSTSLRSYHCCDFSSEHGLHK